MTLNIIYLRGGIMVKAKILSVIVLSGAIVTNQPAKAFWPVMDFGEVPEIISNVSTSMSALSETKAQMTEMKNAFQAMGQSIDNIAQFGQDLRNTVSNIQDVANSAVDGLNENLGTDIEIPEDVNNGFDATEGALGGELNDIINDTQNIINQGEDYIDKGSSGIDDAQETAKKADEGMQKVNAKNEAEKAKREEEKKKKEQEEAEKQETATEPVEEEEEEEEIAENEAMLIQQEEILGNIEAFEEDSKQIIAQMNDVLDTAISTLNKSSQSTNKILDRLEKSIKTTEQLGDKDKEDLVQKVASLRIKCQNMSDKTIALIENAKESYNIECQNKLIDGISNYKKTIESYFRGDTSKDEVLKKGEELKVAFAEIDTSIDKKTLEQQRKATEDIKNDLKAIVAEINVKKKIKN